MKFTGVILACIVASQSLVAQAAPTFDVASIKPSAPGFRQPDCSTLPGGLFTCHNIQLKYLFRLATGTGFFTTKGEPAWFDETYDIDAKIDSDKEMSTAELRVPLLALFRERFGLVSHEEAVQETYFILERQPSGSKLTPSAPGTQSSIVNGDEASLFKGETMVTFAARLSSPAFPDVNARVVDNTGLVGQFDFAMPYISRGDVVLPQDPAFAATVTRRLVASYASTSDALLSIGLKLRQAKREGTALVIDQIHRPSEN